MLEFFFSGLATAVGFIIILLKLPTRRILYFDVIIDGIYSLGLVFLMSGTYSGLVSAVMSGLFFSGMLWALKGAIGYDRPRIRGGVIVWERVPARWFKR